MSTELEHHSGSGLAVTGEQSNWTPTQRAQLAHMGLEDVDEPTLAAFFHHCQRTGLDPFRKQCYLIMRREDGKPKPTIQTGIDGFRLIGQRAARRLGDTVSKRRPLWCDAEGTWREVWTDPAHPPAAAMVAIEVNGAPNEATCNYHEYVQRTREGNPNRMWKTMPANQLAKCAEAAAWRMAYPDDFSAVSLDVEPHHEVIDSDGAPARRPGPKGAGVAGLEQHLEQQRPAQAVPTDLLTDEQFDKIVAGLGRLFPGEGTDQQRREYVIQSIGGRVVSNLRELGRDEAGELLVAITADLEREETDKGQL